jgi:hypothetical protein
MMPQDLVGKRSTGLATRSAPFRPCVPAVAWYPACEGTNEDVISLDEQTN